ncbi:hypothetical protein B0H16DRAFT_1324493, partial [Mycena metata]
WYHPNGGISACGSPLQNSDTLAALGEENWDEGAHCGHNINVQYQGRSIMVSVQDLCPGCQGVNGIDLPEGAIAVIDPNYKADGVISIVRSFE